MTLQLQNNYDITITKCPKPTHLVQVKLVFKLGVNL